MKIEVKPGLSIGEGCPTFIIAEVGSNWSTLEDCMTSITKAKQCGADAVKFQAYNWHALYGHGRSHTYDGDDDGAVWPVDKLAGVLPLDWLPNLKEKADAVGIEFMCSAFSPELLDAVDPHVSIHKVASSEMCHLRMLERLREIGKPVILSTGAQTEPDIHTAWDALGYTPVIPMYCVAAYPANRVDLYQLNTLRNITGENVGYSDHTVDVETIPPLAQSHGACVIEKHVNFVGATGPDAPHSIDAEDLSRMVFTIRGRKYAQLNTPPGFYSAWVGPTPAEKDMITRHKRRLIATTTIKEGETLTEGVNFGIYRSLREDTHAFSPWMVNEVQGRIAKREIRAGCGVGPGDV